MNPNLIKRIYRPAFKRAAKRTLLNRRVCLEGGQTRALSIKDIHRVLARHWAIYDDLKTDLPHAPTFGARMNLGLACATLSFFLSLWEEGIERREAIDLVARSAWTIYEKWGIIPKTISSLAHRKSVDRIRLCVRMFMRFPFNPPSYRFDLRRLDRGVAMDVHYCPIAEYFKSHNAGDLCKASWCDQDYPLAEMWGAVLTRTTTRVEGADQCDFRFEAVDKPR